MGLSGNTTSVGLLIILSSHKCILSTEAMSDTGRGTGDTVGTKTSVTGKVPWNRSLSLALVLQAWESKGSSQCHGNTSAQEATLTISWLPLGASCSLPDAHWRRRLIRCGWSGTWHICLTDEGRLSFKTLANIIVLINSNPSQRRSPPPFPCPWKGFQGCPSHWLYSLWRLTEEVKRSLYEEQRREPEIEVGPAFHNHSTFDKAHTMVLLN